jgi:hypothetical protein
MDILRHLPDKTTRRKTLKWFSSPVGDANKIRDFHEPAVFLHDPI